MTQDVIDPELLGMFLDGSATAAERAQVMELAASSPRAMRELREAVAIHGELTGEPVAWPVAGTVPMHTVPSVAPPTAGTPARSTDVATGWRTRRTLSLGLLAAAALAVVFAASLRRSTPGAIEIGQVARADETAGPGSMTRLLGPGWNSAATGMQRGSERGSIDGTERAFATGVWAARFEVASVARDTTAAVQVVNELRVMLREVAGVAPVLARLHEAARDAAGSSDDVRVTMVQQLRTMSGDGHCFDVGLWRGAMDLAVLRTGGDASTDRSRLAAAAAGCLAARVDTE